jgi:hypothetical protein
METRVNAVISSNPTVPLQEKQEIVPHTFCHLKLSMLPSSIDIPEVEKRSIRKVRTPTIPAPQANPLGKVAATSDQNRYKNNNCYFRGNSHFCVSQSCFERTMMEKGEVLQYFLLDCSSGHRLCFTF